MKKNSYCNPLDLTYEYRIYEDGCITRPICLEAADPVMVVFEDEYYLFSSITKGYWVSDDMVSWQFIDCDDSKLPNIYNYAPAVMVLDGAIYFHQGLHDKRLFRNKTPKNPDTWELVTDNCYIGHDPFMYYDEIDDRVWASYGCGVGEEEYIKVVELDRKTLEPIGEVYECIKFDPKNRGWERQFDDHTKEEAGWTEGSQILRHGNKWYLIYSGFSLHKSYSNGVYVSDSPTGPYVYAQNNPVSHKNTGFVGGAGHGCFFEDKFGNWWNVTCASVLITHGFERRINMFPAGFDEDGFLYTNTTLGDYPIMLPDGKRDHRQLHVPYMLLSKGCTVTVSSEEKAMPENDMYGDELETTQVPESRYVHIPEYAVDEDIRTLWAADNRNPGEWIALDLGRVCDARALQLNIHTYNLLTADPEEKYHEYVIESSEDGVHYQCLIDTRGKRTFDPHAYHEIEVRARYFKVTFYHVAGNGFAAVSDFRIFGTDDSAKPDMVQNVQAKRGPDMRNCTLTWDKVRNADGYIIRYGIAPDKLYNQYQVYNNQVEIRTLTIGISYYFRVDSFNGNGITIGKVTEDKEMSDKKKWVLGCLAPKCGTLADGYYNAGPMMADDRNGATPDDSKMQVVSEVKEADFNEYISELKAAGANGYLERSQGKDKCFAFAQDEKYYHVNYIEKRGEIRVIEDVTSTTLPDFAYTERGTEKTVFYQYGLYYDPANDCTDKTVNCGMLYIIRLSDNSLFMVDGGFIFQCTDEMMAALWQFLLRITNTPENGTIRIAGWYFTHAHDDHIDGCTKLLNRHHDQIVLERILFNFPHYPYTWGYSDATYDMKAMVMKHYPQVKWLKLHKGQKFSLADMEIEVLYTQEDAAEKEDLGKIYLDDFNCTSSILKLTIDGKHVMMLGDTNEETERLMEKYSEPELWKSDMVQVAHHCFNYLDTLYEWIAAPVAVMPNSYFGSHTPENLGKLAGVLKWLKDDHIYYEGQGTDGFVATENGFEHVENLPVIGGPYDGSGF